MNKNSKYNVGDKVLTKDLSIYGVVKVVHDNGRYSVNLMCEHTHKFVTTLSYDENELEKFHIRPYIVRGDELFTVTKRGAESALPLGTWGVWDVEQGRYLALITSGGSRLMVNKMAAELNEGRYF